LRGATNRKGETPRASAQFPEGKNSKEFFINTKKMRSKIKEWGEEEDQKEDGLRQGALKRGEKVCNTYSPKGMEG